MIAPILNRLAVPLLIYVVGGISAIFIQQYYFSKPCPKAPDCICPTPELQSIDFEKVKNFKGTINLHQHYTVQVESDSTILIKAIRDAFDRNSGRRKSN